jgi:hypothetical protein
VGDVDWLCYVNIGGIMKVRDALFKGFTGCSNHNCIIRKPEGMGTNGSCKCLFDLSRSQLHILTSRLGQIADYNLIPNKFQAVPKKVKAK